MRIINELLSEFKKLPDEVKSLISYINSHPKSDVNALKIYWINISRNLDKNVVNKVIDIIERSQNPVINNKLIDNFALHITDNVHMLRLVIDTSKNKVYLVSPKEEHLEVTARLLNKRKEDIYKDPSIARNFVGATITIKDDEIVSLVVGGTGLKLGAKIKYDARTIDKAFSLAFEFITKGEIPVGKMEIRKVV